MWSAESVISNETPHYPKADDILMTCSNILKKGHRRSAHLCSALF